MIHSKAFPTGNTCWLFTIDPTTNPWKNDTWNRGPFRFHCCGYCCVFDPPKMKCRFVTPVRVVENISFKGGGYAHRTPFIPRHGLFFSRSNFVICFRGCLKIVFTLLYALRFSWPSYLSSLNGFRRFLWCCLTGEEEETHVMNSSI